MYRYNNITCNIPPTMTAVERYKKTGRAHIINAVPIYIYSTDIILYTEILHIIIRVPTWRLTRRGKSSSRCACSKRTWRYPGRPSGSSRTTARGRARPMADRYRTRSRARTRGGCRAKVRREATRTTTVQKPTPCHCTGKKGYDIVLFSDITCADRFYYIIIARRGRCKTHAFKLQRYASRWLF